MRIWFGQFTIIIMPMGFDGLSHIKAPLIVVKDQRSIQWKFNLMAKYKP